MSRAVTKANPPRPGFHRCGHRLAGNGVAQTKRVPKLEFWNEGKIRAPSDYDENETQARKEALKALMRLSVSAPRAVRKGLAEAARELTGPFQQSVQEALGSIDQQE